MTIHRRHGTHDPATQKEIADALKSEGFHGEVTWDAASRAAMSTDNSIYEIRPHIIAAPIDADDVFTLMSTLSTPKFGDLPVTARGGGTGTNGQALNTGLIVDFRRHMNRILALNVEEGWVDVEPGIVLDDLNTRLASTGLFFAPTTSTSNRCTIGGMVATDASGKGSRIYGKTSDNVLGLDLMLEGGKRLSTITPLPDWSSPLIDQLVAACDLGRTSLLSHVPPLSRRFTGYDLERARPNSKTFEWWRLPIGAEGTLGLVTRIRLRLVPRPKHKRLAVLAFATFSDALDAGSALLAYEPLAIEVMDEWVQGLAQKAGLLDDLPEALTGGATPLALNFIELAGDDENLLQESLAALRKGMEGPGRPKGLVGMHVARDDAEMARLWSVRAASVGLLGKTSGPRRPIAFVEDCVVPVENLAAFVGDLTTAFTAHGLRFGMYGHVDVGCLHIRPALDMDTAGDRVLMKTLSDEVYALTKRHGGIFWGEHGKGIRGTYLSDFVGAKAYDAFQRIKAAMDPLGRFNPGKLVSVETEMHGIATTPFRPFNVDPSDPLTQAFRCNGNAQCLSYQKTVPMCPSYKATLDLRHSPKGRADMLRDWHRTLNAEPDVRMRQDTDTFAALDLCLGCKACATACPVQVDIPEMKSHFLETYYRARRRPLADHAALVMERFAPVMAQLRPVAASIGNILLPLAQRILGFRDLPRLSLDGLAKAGYRVLPAGRIRRMAWPGKTVCLVQDPFTALFDTQAIIAVADGLLALGYRPIIVSAMAGGKAAHVLGDRKGFRQQAKRLRKQLDRIAAGGLPMVGIDPAFVMMLRQEYQKAGLHISAPVLLPQEFLASRLDAGDVWPTMRDEHREKLFLHCTEATQPHMAAQWRRVFERLGLSIEVVSTGCCGMAGLFGHLDRHQTVSRNLFALSWESHIEGEERIVATGFSCRCQTERFSKALAIHPMGRIAEAFAPG